MTIDKMLIILNQIGSENEKRVDQLTISLVNGSIIFKKPSVTLYDQAIIDFQDYLRGKSIFQDQNNEKRYLNNLKVLLK